MAIDNSGIPTLSVLHEEIRKLRNDVDRHERLLEQIATFDQKHGLSLLPTWSPVEESACLAQLDVSPRKVRLIERPDEKAHDSLTKLKETWLGNLYLNHLKKYALVRSFSIFIWRTAYPLYVNHLSSHIGPGKADRKWRRLTKLREFSEKKNVPTLKIADESFVRTPCPDVLPEEDKTFLVSPHESYNFPEVYISTISNGTVYGGTNLVLAGAEVICHDLYDFERDSTSEELHGRTLIDPKSQRIRWLLHDDAPEAIPLAATFVDACAPNYAHWLTEVLPRVALFCSEPQFNDVPIIVNDGLHQNIMESLALVVGSEREIITLPIGRALVADILYLTSVTGYVPFERRNNKLLGHSHGIFSPKAYDVCREKIGIFTEKPSEVTCPDKIFLRRNSGARKVLNAPEIERYFQSMGYALVEPEKLTFLQQVMVFNNAKIIVGSSGAALANIVFAPKDAQIYIFISRFKDTSYWYWQNIACATENEVNYILGESEGIDNSIHSSFRVSLLTLKEIFGDHGK